MNALIASIIIAFSGNEAGGRIALTNERGQCSADQFAAFSFASTGEYVVGCWLYRETLVIVTWADGTKRIYPSDNFELTPEAREGGG